MKHHIEILRFLQNNGSVSGRELARQLGISVSAVDNCVRALRDWEFRISDLPGTGYQLTESLSSLMKIGYGKNCVQKVY